MLGKGRGSEKSAQTQDKKQVDAVQLLFSLWRIWSSWLWAQSCPQLCLTLLDPLDCSPPDFSVHGILQTRILEWVVIFFSRASYRPRDQTQVSCTAGRFFTNWATRKAFMCLRVWVNSIRCKKMNVISNRSGLFGLPRWHGGKEYTWQCRKHKRYCFNPRVRKIPWRRKRQATPVFLPEKSHRQRSLVGYSPRGCKELDMTEWQYIQALGPVRHKEAESYPEKDGAMK